MKVENKSNSRSASRRSNDDILDNNESYEEENSSNSEDSWNSRMTSRRKKMDKEPESEQKKSKPTVSESINRQATSSLKSNSRKFGLLILEIFRERESYQQFI